MGSMARLRAMFRIYSRYTTIRTEDIVVCFLSLPTVPDTLAFAWREDTLLRQTQARLWLLLNKGCHASFRVPEPTLYTRTALHWYRNAPKELAEMAVDFPGTLVLVKVKSAGQW